MKIGLKPIENCRAMKQLIRLFDMESTRVIDLTLILHFKDFIIYKLLKV